MHKILESGFDDPTKDAERTLLERKFAQLVQSLGDGQWHTARQLKQHGFTDRELRELAEENDATFVTGNRGYKLMSLATADEIRECAARLRSQAVRMTRRAVHLINIAHKRLHAPARERLI